MQQDNQQDILQQKIETLFRVVRAHPRPFESINAANDAIKEDASLPFIVTNRNDIMRRASIFFRARKTTEDALVEMGSVASGLLSQPDLPKYAHQISRLEKCISEAEGFLLTINKTIDSCDKAFAAFEDSKKK